MKPCLHVVAPGLLTTIQDRGRFGYQHLGVPVSGALDPVSLHAANLLVGNPPDAGALEAACVGPTLAVEADDVRIAVVGANAAIDILPGVAAEGGRSVARTSASSSSCAAWWRGTSATGRPRGS